MQVLLNTCTTNKEASKKYFRDLNFQLIEEDSYTLAYDENLKIIAHYDHSARTGLTLIKECWSSELQALKSIVNIISKENAHYFASPSGTWFKLIEGEEIPFPKTTSKCLMGNYAGISLETLDIQKSLKILNALGFSKSGGGIEQGWISCTDVNQNTISLMAPFSCPHSFVNPSGTFFNSGQNPKIIANIRQKNIPIYEEITVFNKQGEVDNIILREPGGIGFFVFND